MTHTPRIKANNGAIMSSIKIDRVDTMHIIANNDERDQDKKHKQKQQHQPEEDKDEKKDEEKQPKLADRIASIVRTTLHETLVDASKDGKFQVAIRIEDDTTKHQVRTYLKEQGFDSITTYYSCSGYHQDVGVVIHFPFSAAE